MWSNYPPPAVTVFGLLAMFVAGCASSAGSAKPLTAAAKADTLARYSKISVVTSARGEASGMTAADQERIGALVAQKVTAGPPPNRFTVSTTIDPETLRVSIEFTRYDEGNAFARLMLAGLGQIHIDAEVTLEDCARQVVVSKFEVTKTFSWGGIYGGTTCITDVEAGFAEAVAKVVLGQGTE
jgi:hypothetical protein